MLEKNQTHKNLKTSKKLYLLITSQRNIKGKKITVSPRAQKIPPPSLASSTKSKPSRTRSPSAKSRRSRPNRNCWRTVRHWKPEARPTTRWTAPHKPLCAAWLRSRLRRQRSRQECYPSSSRRLKRSMRMMRLRSCCSFCRLLRQRKNLPLAIQLCQQFLTVDLPLLTVQAH